MGEPRYTQPETLESLVHHLRVLSDKALEQIDADRLLRAAEELPALQAENARLREVEEWQTMARAQHFLRRNLNAPEDPHVAVLCERHGYGAVMDAASRLWARKDGLGAFYIGGCIGMKSDEQARAALEAKP